MRRVNKFVKIFKSAGIEVGNIRFYKMRLASFKMFTGNIQELLTQTINKGI